MVYLLISLGPHVITHNISLYMLHIPKSYFIIHFPLHTYGIQYIENTSWKVRAYGIYGRVVDVSEIERVSAANE